MPGDGLRLVEAAAEARAPYHGAERARGAAAGFTRLVLETGCRQQPAMRLYERCGFTRIPPFGPYADDPTSVCYGKDLVAPTGPGV